MELEIAISGGRKDRNLITKKFLLAEGEYLPTFEKKGSMGFHVN